MKQSTLLFLLPVITIAILSIASKAFLSQFLLGRNWIVKEGGQQQQLSASRRTSSSSAIAAAAASNTKLMSSLFGSDAADGDERLVKAAPEKVHFIILVHGWMGNSKEMGYLQKAIEKETELWRRKQPGHRVVVHSAVSNDGKTHDGIAAGGQRLADEITHFINNVSELLSVDDEDNNPTTFSLSFVGNSLGGLYARYALSQIPFLHDGGGGPTVQPKIFCTTATPHLGVSKHTYLPLPRSLEHVVANAMLPTGRDLFRVTDVIDKITVDPQFVKPLNSFHKRIAYANTHSTDFQVPTATAAFLAESNSIHRKVTANGDSDDVHDRPFVSLAVETEKRIPIQTETEVVIENNGSGSNNNNDSKRMTSAQLAERLDALGWHKVLCDVRESLLSIPIPFKSNSKGHQHHHHKDEYSSQELLHRYASGILSDDRFHFPFGHSVLVANSKNKQYEKWNAAGQPIMDHLAADLIRDIMTDN